MKKNFYQNQSMSHELNTTGYIVREIKFTF